MSAPSRLLGFDVRSLRSSENEWDATRREHYLLRPEIAHPVSVDRVVMSSVFEFSKDAGDQTKITLPPRDYHQQALRLWRDQEEMEQEVSKRSNHVASQDLLWIAITLAGVGRDLNDPYWQDFFIDDAAVEKIEQRWKSIGFDVADRYLTSGLSNCGLGQETPAVRKTWATQLNDRGLFNDVNDALKFSEFLNLRVKEHAPFFVYEIYRKGDNGVGVDNPGTTTNRS